MATGFDDYWHDHHDEIRSEQSRPASDRIPISYMPTAEQIAERLAQTTTTDGNEDA